jgi:hypothetical protein
MISVHPIRRLVHTRRSRGNLFGGLGFISVPISPSPDPVSLALDGVAAFLAVFSAFQARKNARQAQENEVVQVQNRLAAALDPISQAAQDPNVTADQLVTLGNQVETLGKQFYDYTQSFSIAGPGARQTIFGDEIAPGQFTTTAAHPGWLTRLLDFIKTKLGEKTGVTPQLGFDWTTLENLGLQIVRQVTGQPPAVVTTLPPGQTPATYYAQQNAIPTWVWPAGLGLLTLIVVGNLTGSKR